ncbi:MAG: hypothetical protein IJD10_07240, partial [Clostridia bacterium]|nr:hypothetical protein [Clostridia bacterium]
MNSEKKTQERRSVCQTYDGGIIYPFPEDEPRSELYHITVNGKAVPCYTCRVSAMPYNRHWEYDGPWHQRPLDQTEEAAFVSFGITGPAEVTVTVAKPFHEVLLRPRARGGVRVTGERIVTFTVTEPGQFSFEVDGRHQNLHFFVEDGRDYERERRNATYYFAPGIHHTKEIELKDGESVFLEAGAVVHGSIRAEGAENVGVYGRGILDGSLAERQEDEVDRGHAGLLNFIRCRNVTVDGPILRDSEWWGLSVYNGENIECRNVKSVGMWRYNSDGLDFVNSRNVHVSGCFLRTYDDSIVIKGLRWQGHEERNNENYLIENCVLWCDWGGALEIGCETVADEYVNIVYRNCDIIGASLGAMRIHSGDRAFVHHILYDTIRIEYTK